MDRTFSKVGKGSLRGSIFSLCACAIGSGVLSLPYVLALCGWALGISFIVVGAIAAVWSNTILAELAVDNGLANLSQLATKAGGPKLEKSLSWMILVYMFGSCISYQIIITSLFKYLCSKFGMSDDTVNSTMFSIYQAVPTAIFILFPMSMKKDMSAFRYVSLASIGALFYTGVVLIIELPSYYNHFSSNANMTPAYWDWNFFTGCSMTFFAYTCQVQLLPIYSELQNPNYKRIKKVINRSIFIDFLFYLTIAMAGYFSQFKDTAPIVLERVPLPGVDRDYPLLLGVLLVMLCLMVAFPVNYNPFRQHFFSVILGRHEFSLKENFIVTSIFQTITCFISIIFPNVKSVISIMGGLIAVSMCYLIPLICQL
jgi:amino acid permease